jgi:glycosyltransferase involved in cell wall biosynthesis
VFVAPIFTGAGLRVKILEAALCGIPLVISPIANLGINLADKEEAFICKSIEEFNEVLRDFFSSKFDEIVDEMRLNARYKIAAEFNETIVKDKIISVFDRIIT